MNDLVDSHCHLDFPALVADRTGVLVRAREAGVVRMLNISTRLSDCDAVRATAESFDEVYCAFGIHPHHAHEDGRDDSTDMIVEKVVHPKVVGIGETGLDFFYDKAPREVQEESFRRHIRAARETNLPLIIHSRDAEEETMRILREAGPVTGVIHCFSSRRILAEEALAFGFYISLSGILTFKKSQELRDIVKDVPLDRLLVETDAPYLAPEPYRGKTGEPSFVVRTAQVLAEVKGISFDELAKQTTENFFRLFTKVPALS